MALTSGAQELLENLSPRPLCWAARVIVFETLVIAGLLGYELSALTDRGLARAWQMSALATAW